jgi:LuxR family maltose regulon positive regulatory protein
MASLLRAGHHSDAIGCALALADIEIAQGRLHAALRTYEQGLQLATAQGAPLLRGAADMLVGMSELQYEQNDLDAAARHVQRSQELGEHLGLPQHPYRWRVTKARIQAAQGDLDGALGLLNEAERVYTSDFSPHVRPVAALKARVWLMLGRLGEARDWAREQGLSAQDELSYLREFEHITLARVLLAHSRSNHADRSVHEALRLLERLLHAAQAGERMKSVVEILMLLSLAHQAHGDIPAALAALSRALALAEPEGYVRLFVDEGLAMAALLERVNASAVSVSRTDADERMKQYAARLLAAFTTDVARPAAPSPQPSAPSPQPLVEPLSDRERDVLRLLRSELDGPEIARQLMISLNTLRTHTKNIYSKLGVSSRRAAVRRAEELKLL